MAFRSCSVSGSGHQVVSLTLTISEIVRATPTRKSSAWSAGTNVFLRNEKVARQTLKLKPPQSRPFFSRYAVACRRDPQKLSPYDNDKLKHIGHPDSAIYLFLPALYNIKFFGTYKLDAVPGSRSLLITGLCTKQSKIPPTAVGGWFRSFLLRRQLGVSFKSHPRQWVDGSDPLYFDLATQMLAQDILSLSH